MMNLAGPDTGGFQFAVNRFKGTGGHAFQEGMAVSPNRLRTGVAVQLLAPAIPVKDTSFHIPGKNRVVRQFRNLADRIHYGRYGQGHLDGEDVFVDAHVFELLDADARFDLLDENRFFRSTIGRQNPVNGLADDVFAGVAEHQFGAFVPGLDAPLQRFAHDGIGG